MCMDPATRVKSQKKIKSTIVFFAIGLCLILSLPSSYVEAAPRDPGFDRGSCQTNRDLNDKILSTTCCWRDKIPGQFLAKAYCQTCDANSANCGDKVEQKGVIGTFPDAVIQPDNEIIADNPMTQQPSLKSDKDSVIEDKITGEPLQFSTSNEEIQENAEFTESDNSGEEFNTQGNDNSDGSQESSGIDNSRNTENISTP